MNKISYFLLTLRYPGDFSRHHESCVFPNWLHALTSSGLLEAGVDIRTVQELLGHKSIETTQIYLHVLEKPGKCLPSPLQLVA